MASTHCNRYHNWAEVSLAIAQANVENAITDEVKATEPFWEAVEQFCSYPHSCDPDDPDTIPWPVENSRSQMWEAADRHEQAQKAYEDASEVYLATWNKVHR